MSFTKTCPVRGPATARAPPEPLVSAASFDDPPRSSTWGVVSGHKPSSRTTTINENKLSRKDFLFSALAAGMYSVLADPRVAFTQINAQNPNPKGAKSTSMEEGRSSITAQGAAIHRAAHQLLDVPKVFDGPLALRIWGGGRIMKTRI